MLVGFAEGLGAAKTYAAREHYEIDPNRERLGLGGANLASGLSGGMVVNGSLSKTALNASAAVGGAVVLRIESGLFFANAEPVRERIAATAREEGVRVIVIHLEIGAAAGRQRGADAGGGHRRPAPHRRRAPPRPRRRPGP